MPIWYRKNSGNWNNNPSADPSSNTGGYALTGLVNASMVPFGIANNTNSTFNFGTTGFAFSVPSGFIAGWPNSTNTGFTILDSSTLQGNASIQNAQNTKFGSDPVVGMAFAITSDQRSIGSYYFELQLTGGLSVFAANSGVGVCRPGANINNLLTGGFNNIDPNGGTTANTSSVFGSDPVHAWVSTNDLNSNLFTIVNNDTICVAITFERSKISQVWLNL